MRTVGFVFAIIISTLIFGSLNYYIGLRGWQKVGSLIPYINSKVYWGIFWLIALSFILARLGEKFLPDSVENYLVFIGDYWMAAMMYFLILLPLVDLIRFGGRRIAYFKSGGRAIAFFQNYYGVLVFLLMIGLLIYGTWSAQNIKLAHYDIDINKKAGTLKELHVVMMSDSHLGNIVDNKRLEKMVEKINEQNPDIVLMAGDIVDEKVDPFINQGMGETMKKIQSKYGVYAITGNHEFYGGDVEKIVKVLEESGVKFLRDDFVKVADSFYVVGREDISIESYYKKKRKSLNEILDGSDNALPVIMMDHNPRDLKEPQENGVDLQLSGHTHRGQMFPNQYFTKMLYEIDWGHLKKDNYNIIVSSGIGTWGPPIRIGNSSELVDITLHFNC